MSRYSPCVFLVILCILSLAACQAQEQMLDFQTLAKTEPFDLGAGHQGKEPAVMVFSEIGDVRAQDQSGSIMDRHLAGELYSLEYDRYIAILVLYGYVGSTGFAVTVRSVTRCGNQITIHAEFARVEGQYGHDMFTSPYHLVAISKAELSGENVNFVLLDGSEVVAESKHYIR